MPHDTDLVPGEGWAFWACLAVAAGVTVGASLNSDRWWLTVLGMLGVYGAITQMIAELRRDRKLIEARARRAENDRIRQAMRDAAQARLDELDRRRP